MRRQCLSVVMGVSQTDHALFGAFMQGELGLDRATNEQLWRV